MKKRILALLMVFVMVLLCFAGCGSDGEVVDSVTSSSKVNDKNKPDKETNKDENKDEDDDKNKSGISAVFLVDVSASMKPYKENAIQLMKETFDGLSSEGMDVEVSIVAYSKYIEYSDDFTNDYSGAIEGFSKTEFVHYPETDTGLGLRAAAEKLEDLNKYDKAVYLFTDGKSTVEGEQLAAKTLIDMGVELTTVNVSHEQEVQLVSVSTNGRVPQGGTVQVEFVIKSTKLARKVELKIEDGNIETTKFVDLQLGENVVKMEYAPEKAGVNVIRASVSAEARYDQLDENNALYTWYSLEDKKTILIVDGDYSGDKSQFDQVMNGIDWDILGDNVIKIVGTNNFPTSLEGLLKYDQVVLMDVDMNELHSGAASDLKRYVEECGRGLFVSFGDKIYECYDEYNQSALGEILPVTISHGEDEVAAVVIALDLSNSMKELVEGRSRFELAVESIKNTIMLTEEQGGLADDDYVGVVCFDSGAYVALEMQRLGDVENRAHIRDAVEWELRHYYNWYYLNPDGTESEYPVGMDDGDVYTRLGYTYPNDAKYPRGGYDKETGRAIRSYGTNYKWAIQEVSDMLADKSDEALLHVKQVIFMSDGAPSDAGSGYIDIVERMASGGIVTSTIAIGLDLNVNNQPIQKGELAKIAKAGNGDCVVAETIDEIKGAILDTIKTVASSKSVVNERNVLVKQNSYNSMVMTGVTGLDVTIGGYYPSVIKENADLVLYVDNMRPLYAEWQYGLGKVSVYMSDLGNEGWTQKLFENTSGKILVSNMLTVNVNENPDSSGILYEAELDSNNKLTVEAVVPVELRYGEMLVLNVLSKDGDVIETVRFAKVASRRYLATFDCENNNSAYMMTIYLVDASGTICDSVDFCVPVRYSDEFDVIDNAKEQEDSENEEEKGRVRIAFISEYVQGEDAIRSPLYYALVAAGFSISSEDRFESAEEAYGISGYDIYIYEGITPIFLPTDGAVWLIDAEYAFFGKTGISIGDSVPADKENGYLLSKSLSLDSAVTQLLNNVHLDIPVVIAGQEAPAAVMTYRPIESYGGAFSSIYKANDQDVFIAGNYKSVPMIITTFDFAETSIIAFVTDFPILIKNMVEYSVE